jgi:simple sugar transport system permease protein
VSFPSARLLRMLRRREASIVAVTLITAGVFALRSDRFLTGGNFVALLPYFAPFAILAAGEVLVMVAAEIDLSIGAVYLFAPYMFYEFHRAGLPLTADFVLALLCCGVVGVINGVVTMHVGIHSFITTLATLLGVGGFTLIISHAAPVQMPGSPVLDSRDTPLLAELFGASRYSELIWALIIVTAVQVLLKLTRWGIYTVAAGSDRVAAAEAGIDVKLTVVRNFVVCSVLAGLVGVMEANRVSSINPDTAGASETMFRAISAAVIGGTLLAGGAGTAVGALFGALFLGVLRDGLVIGGTRASHLDLFIGVGILIAMSLNVIVRQAQARRRPAPT